MVISSVEPVAPPRQGFGLVAGQRFDVTLTIRNNESITAPPKAIKFLLTRDRSFSDDAVASALGFELGPRNIPAIRSGESADLSFTLTVPEGVEPGIWYVQAVLNPIIGNWSDDIRNSTTGGTNASNNNYSVGIGVDGVEVAIGQSDSTTPPPLPTGVLPNYRGRTLSIDSPTDPSGSFQPGGMLTLRYSLSNTGTTSVANLPIGVYLAPRGTTPAVSSTDRLLGTIQISDFVTATSRTYTTSIPVPTVTSSGSYTLGFIFDPNNVVAESNESDNRNQGVGIDLANLVIAAPATTSPPMVPPTVPPVVPPTVPPVTPTTPSTTTPVTPPITTPVPSRPEPALSGQFLSPTALALRSGSSVQFIELPPGSSGFFADLNGDATNDLVLILPNLAIALDGATGRPLAVVTDGNGDGFRDIYIFSTDGSVRVTDGRAGRTV